MRCELRLASSPCPALLGGRAKTDRLWPSVATVSPSRLAASVANGRTLYRDELSASEGHVHWSLVAADACGENVAVGFLQINNLRVHKAIEHLVPRPIPAQHQYLIADRCISSGLPLRRTVCPALRSGVDIALPPKAAAMDASSDEAMLPTDRAKPDIAIVGVVTVLQLVSRAQMIRSLETIDVVFNANSLGSKRPKCADRRFQ